MSPSSTHRLRAPLVGRDRELRTLEQAFDRALGGRLPQLATLTGAPGVGKSRLLREFLADLRARSSGVEVRVAACREDGPALGPIRDILRGRFGITEEMAPQVAFPLFRDGVHALIGERRTGEFVRFLGAFLDLELPSSPLTDALDEEPAQRLRLGRTVLRRFLELDADATPLVIAIEDCHWAHEDLLSLLEYVAETAQDVPLLIIAAGRNELLQQRGELPEERDLRIDLSPLEPDDTATMVEHLLSPTGEPPEELIDTAVDMATGNPYLVEQIVRSFLAEGVLVPLDDGAWAVDLRRVDDIELPLSVEDAIAARIAALTPSERNTLEMAATIGGVFWLGSLLTLERLDGSPPDDATGAESDRARLRAMLEDLIARDYLLEMPDSTITGDPEYAFKHNLERESLRRFTSATLQARYHLAIAEWLEPRLGEPTEEHCELLAQHFERGGAPHRAALHFLAAGERARRRLSAARAADYYRRGLVLLAVGESNARVRALEHYGEALQQCGRSDDALGALEGMRRLAYRLDLPGEIARAHGQLGRVHRDQGKLAAALGHYEAAHQLFSDAGDLHGEASALESMGVLQGLRGNAEGAEHLIREALSTFDGLGDDRAIARCHNDLGIVLREALRWDEALESFQEALWRWRKIDDAQGVAESLTFQGVVQGHLGDDGEAERLWNEALSLARTSGDRVRESVVLTCLGGSAYRAGEGQRSISLLQEAESIAASLGDRMQEADTLRSLAKARALIGDLPGAMRDVERAVRLFDSAGSKPQLGVALRTRAEISGTSNWSGRGGADPAREFERSMRLLEEVGHDLELARSCEAYASYLARTKHEAAREQVAGLRKRAKDLLERRRGLTIRPSRIPAAAPPRSRV